MPFALTLAWKNDAWNYVRSKAVLATPQHGMAGLIDPMLRQTTPRQLPALLCLLCLLHLQHRQRHRLAFEFPLTSQMGQYLWNSTLMVCGAWLLPRRTVVNVLVYVTIVQRQITRSPAAPFVCLCQAVDPVSNVAHSCQWKYPPNHRKKLSPKSNLGALFRWNSQILAPIFCHPKFNVCFPKSFCTFES